MPRQDCPSVSAETSKPKTRHQEFSLPVRAIITLTLMLILISCDRA